MTLKISNQPVFKLSHFSMFVTDIAKLTDVYTGLLDFTVAARGPFTCPDRTG